MDEQGETRDDDDMKIQKLRRPTTKGMQMFWNALLPPQQRRGIPFLDAIDFI